MNVAFLIASEISDISGGMRVIVQYANFFQSIGHSVVVWHSSKNDKPYFQTNFKIEHYNPSKIDEPDLVILTDPMFISTASQRRTGKTIVLLQHDYELIAASMGVEGYGSLLKQEYDYLSSSNVKIITVSTWLHDAVKQKYGLESEVVLNGIDSQLFKPVSPCITARETLIGVMYDSQEWKGFPQALNLILNATQNIQSFKIVIVSKFFPEFPDANGQSWVLDYPLIFFNRPNQSDLASIYSSLDFFISTSTYEGFGLPALEAMACGAVVLTTDNGGNRDFIRDTQNAFIINPTDMQYTAEILRAVGNDINLCKRVVENAINTGRQFEINKSFKKLRCITEKFVKLYPS